MIEYIALNGLVVYPVHVVDKNVDLDGKTFFCGRKLADQKGHAFLVDIFVGLIMFLQVQIADRVSQPSRK